MDNIKSERIYLRDDDMQKDFIQNKNLANDRSVNHQSTMIIPKSTSLNFELYDSSISKQQTSADVNQSEKSLKIQLVRANLEIERLTLRIRVLDQDIITAKKFADFTEQKLNHQKLEEFIKRVKQIDLFHKREMIQIKEQIESKDNLIQLLKYEIDSLKNEGLKRNESHKKKVLELEDLIEQNKKHQYPSDFFLNETNTEYENFKKQIFDFNLNNVDKTSIIQKLEALCEVSYSSNKKVEKQAEELKAKESIVERQKKELAKSQADSSEADIKIEMLQKECKEKEDYIGQMDDYWNKMASKLKAFQSLQSDKQIIVFKDLFREISQCMLAVNDISVYVIKKEGKINPVDSIFIKKKDIFSNLDTEEDQSSLKLLDAEFLADKLNEIKEVNQALYVLSLELGIRKFF